MSSAWHVWEVTLCQTSTADTQVLHEKWFQPKNIWAMLHTNTLDKSTFPHPTTAKSSKKKPFLPNSCQTIFWLCFQVCNLKRGRKKTSNMFINAALQHVADNSDVCRVTHVLQSLWKSTGLSHKLYIRPQLWSPGTMNPRAKFHLLQGLQMRSYLFSSSLL